MPKLLLSNMSFWGRGGGFQSQPIQGKGGGKGNSNLGFRNQISRGWKASISSIRGGGGINLIYPGFGSMD